MFSVHRCDRLRPLAERLFEQMEEAPLAPLEPEVVVVAQNKGLRAWLENALAGKTGCAASVAMPSPRVFGIELARALVPVDPVTTASGDPIPRDPLDPGPLAWRIAAFLEDLPAEARYDPLRAYLADESERRLPLARRIAERFSDYQVYRPHLLQAWAEGRTPHAELPHADHPHGAWQAALWQHLTGQTPRPDRARHLLQLQSTLNGSEARINKDRLPTRLSIFGAGLLPPLYLDVFEALARHVPVHCYLVGGAAAHTERGNVLRSRLGRQRRLFRSLLCERADEWHALESGLETDRAPDHVPDSMLAVLQADALNGDRRGTGSGSAPFPVADDDRSLSIHSCHSPRRELEVLRDQLLDTFQALPDLKPEDVLVAVPALERYAPLIETTFEAETAGDVRLPVHIASEAWSEARRVFEAAEALLALPESRCTATEVMALLDYPVLRRAAGLAPEEVPVVRRWTREAGVRWGRDAAHKSAFGLPESRAGTWAAGLDRLLLGYAVGPVDAGEEGLVEGRLPWAEATASRADLLGRLAAWLHRLFAFAEAARTSHSMAEWSAQMMDVLADLMAPDPPAEHDAVEHLAEAARELAYLEALSDQIDRRGQRVPFAAVRQHLQAAARGYEAPTEHVTGRITFAEPMTLRFAPYRVVAFLGLGNAYPPPDRRPADDLIGLEPRPADYDAQREGAQLFYDALMAAEDRLILSYVGRSQKDDTERAPSAVLEALLETCENSFAVEGQDAEQQTMRARLVTEHPLQPFSPAYFEADRALFSYDRAHCVARGQRCAVPPFVEEPLLESEETEEMRTPVHLDTLQRAWAHPAKFFCRRVLGLRLEGEETLDGQEPIRPDALAAYQAREATLRLALDGAPPGTWEKHLEARGTLPPGRLGTAWYDQQRSDAEQVAQAVEAQGTRQPRSLRAAGDGWAVAGRLDYVTAECALAFRCAAPKAKDFVRAWAAHLLLCAAEGAGGGDPCPRETLVIGTGPSAWRFVPLAAPVAREHLHRLVRGYRAIRKQPPPLFPKTSMKYAETNSQYKAERAFYDGYYPGEEDDSYVKLCFRGRDPLGEDFDLFAKWAKALWKPLLRHREEARVPTANDGRQTRRTFMPRCLHPEHCGPPFAVARRSLF